MPAKSAGGEKKKSTKKAAKKASSGTKTKSTAKTAVKAVRTKSTKATKPKATSPAKTAKSASKTAGKTTAKVSTKAASAGKVRVRQIRSSIGRRRDFRLTLKALGIRHHQAEIVVNRSPAVDGMLDKVRHMIRVTPEE